MAGAAMCFHTCQVKASRRKDSQTNAPDFDRLLTQINDAEVPLGEATRHDHQGGAQQFTLRLLPIDEHQARLIAFDQLSQDGAAWLMQTLVLWRGAEEEDFLVVFQFAQELETVLHLPSRVAKPLLLVTHHMRII